MARRKKPTKTERHQRRKQRDDKELTALVVEMTAGFTCSFEIARDFAVQCDERQGAISYDLTTSRLAIEFWSGRSSPRAQQILELLGELETASQRHFDLLADLSRRFDAFADDQGDHDHEHLEPVEPYRVRLRQRLFADPPPTPPAGS